MPRLFYFSASPARRTALAEILPLGLGEFPALEVTALKSSDDVTELKAQAGDVALLDLTDEPAPEPPAPCQKLVLRPQGKTQKGDIARPLRFDELRQRLATLLSRRDEETEFTVGPYICIPIERVLLNDEGEEKARLTEKEVTLLRTLREASPGGVSRATLLDRVWGYRDDLDTHTLETHIYRLRQKIEADPEAPLLLLTLESGYALTASEEAE